MGSSSSSPSRASGVRNSASVGLGSRISSRFASRASSGYRSSSVDDLEDEVESMARDLKKSPSTTSARGRVRRFSKAPLWDKEIVAEALGVDADQFNIVVPKGRFRFEVHMASEEAGKDSMSTFLTRGFGYRSEIIFRLAHDDVRPEVVRQLHRLLVSLRQTAGKSGQGFLPYDTLGTSLFPWNNDVLANNRGGTGVLFAPDPMLESLSVPRYQFLCCFALRSEEWKVQRSIPSIPFYEFVVNESERSNPWLVNSTTRESFVTADNVVELRRFARKSKARPKTSVADLDFALRVAPPRGRAANADAAEVLIKRSEVTAVLGLVEEHMFGDPFGVCSLTLTSKDGAQIEFVAGDGVLEADALGRKLVIRANDTLYGNVLPEAWTWKDNGGEEDGSRGEGDDEEEEEGGNSRESIIELSQFLVAPSSLTIVAVDEVPYDEQQ